MYGRTLGRAHALGPVLPSHSPAARATAQVTHACRSSDASDTTVGSRRDRIPSIPSIESTREQSPGDDLFHEPEAQPEFVTAEAPSRDHPTWPPLRWEGLPLSIQAAQRRRRGELTL